MTSKIDKKVLFVICLWIGGFWIFPTAYVWLSGEGSVLKTFLAFPVVAILIVAIGLTMDFFLKLFK